MKLSEVTATADPKHKEKLQQPKMFNVIIFNDDFTPTDFVVDILSRVFGKSIHDAAHLMASAHKDGKAMIGTYPKDIAETKVAQSHSIAKVEGHPLMLTVERVD